MREVPKGGGVYFVRGADLIKIGTTYSFRRRFATLQLGSPVALQLVKVYDGDWRLERMLHLVFADYRRHGEWFDLPFHWRKVADEVSAGRLTCASDDLADRLAEAEDDSLSYLPEGARDMIRRVLA